QPCLPLRLESSAELEAPPATSTRSKTKTRIELDPHRPSSDVTKPSTKNCRKVQRTFQMHQVLQASVFSSLLN
ncbi:hypothetical protein SNEBB_000241, partial [Seison nebaliae]